MLYVIVGRFDELVLSKISQKGQGIFFVDSEEGGLYSGICYADGDEVFESLFGRWKMSKTVALETGQFWRVQGEWFSVDDLVKGVVHMIQISKYKVIWILLI